MGKIKPGEDNADTPEPLDPEQEQKPEVVTASPTEDTNVTEVIALEGVTLKGWESTRKGTHTIHTNDGIYNFVDGEAEFLPDKAEELRKAGLIE